MIYTITLNPALDRTIWVDRIEYDVTNRIRREVRYPGGKGIGVSRVLAALGVKNRALGFLGGFRGAELEALLLGSGIQCNFNFIKDETRSNIVIHVQGTGNQILLASEGPQITADELQQFLETLQGLKDPEIVSIGGSLPPGIEPAFYRSIIDALNRKGARVILDAEGHALRESLPSRPFAIKPNLRELSTAVGMKLTTNEEILSAAEELRSQGVELVLVSMGANGILLVGEGMRWQAIPPTVDVRSTIGAGDSSVAGFIYGLSHGFDLKKCLIHAVAAGTAATLQEGSALAEREDIINLVHQIPSRPVENAPVGG